MTWPAAGLPNSGRPIPNRKETIMSIPTRGEEYARLMEWLRKSQESSAMLAHLYRDDPSTGKAMAAGWLTVSEALKQMQKHVTDLAKRGLQ